MADPVDEALKELNKAVKEAQDAATEVEQEKSTMDAAATKIGGPWIENDAERRELIKVYNQARKNWTAARKRLQKALLEVTKAQNELVRQLIIMATR